MMPSLKRVALAPASGAAMFALAWIVSACAPSDAGNAGAAVDSAAAKASAPPRAVILEPENDAQVTGSSVLIVLSNENIELAPAGDTRAGTGHHHLFVNMDVTPPGEPIPAGVPGIVHLGQAQTSHELANLAPGSYTVISVFGDLAHRRIEPQVTDTVRFRVRLP
jgi:uncharacterized protein DUF4399